MKALPQLYLAGLKEFTRDRMAMFWTLAFPVFFIVIFGIIFSGGNSTTFAVGLAVEDDGPAGAALHRAFQSVSAFKVTDGGRDALLDRLKQGDLRVVVAVPAGLSEAVAAGRTAPVSVYYDPSNQSTAQVVVSIVEQVVEATDRQLAQRPALLTLQPQTVTASGLRTIDFLLPGILAMSLMQLGLLATAPVLVQLREQHVLRRLGATPLPRATLLAAQVLLRLTIGLTQTLIILVVGAVAFNVRVTGSPAALAGVVLLGALTFVCLGYLVSGLAKTEESVVGITQLINFPMMFLSGIFFPVEIMPNWIRPVISAMPLTYLADALRQIMVGGTPAYPLRLDLLILAGWLVVGAVLAVRLFRWE